MALITSAATSNGILTTYDRLPTPLDVAAPIGEQNFSGITAITLSGATDSATFTLQINLARNYAHRIIDFAVSISGVSQADINEWQPAMSGTVSIDKDGQSSVLVDAFELSGGAYETLGSGAAAGNPATAYQTIPTGALAFTRGFSGPIPSRIYDCMDAGRIFLRWFNISSSATAATQAIWRCRTLVYDITQLNQSALMTTRPVSPP